MKSMVFFQYCSDFESEHNVGKLRIIRIHWSKFYDLTPNGVCAMSSHSLIISRTGPDGQTVKKDENTDNFRFFEKLR